MTRFALLTLMMTMSLSVAMSVAVPQAKAANESIVAVVNQGVVTASDLKNRLKLIEASTGLKPSAEMEAKLRPQVLDMLVEELVKTQEAERMKIKVEPEEITEGFNTIAKQNGIEPDIFRKALQQRGINLSTMKDQIRAQLAWNKVIQMRIRPRVEVTDADIDSELDHLKEGVGKTQYRVAEIFLPTTSQGKASTVANLARKLSDQLQQTPQAFPKVAVQFSQSPGAEKGGMIGWVFGDQMPQDIEEILPKLGKGQVSNPIKTSAGYYIVLVVDKRTLSEETLPSREDVLQRIGTERLDRAQRRYLMDLMSSAFVEKRA